MYGVGPPRPHISREMGPRGLQYISDMGPWLHQNSGPLRYMCTELKSKYKTTMYILGQAINEVKIVVTQVTDSNMQLYIVEQAMVQRESP